MKYLVAYSITYAIALVIGWFSPGVPAAAAVGVSHLCGLMGVFIWRLHESTVDSLQRIAAMKRDLSER